MKGTRCGAGVFQQEAVEGEDGPELLHLRKDRGDGSLESVAIFNAEEALKLMTGLALYLGVERIELTER